MPSREKEISDAAVAGITALALAGAPTPVVRRMPSLPAGTEPPAIVVSVRRRADVEYLTNAHNLHTHDGQVTVITAAGEFLAASDTVGVWVDAISTAFELWPMWSTVTGFNDVRLGELVQNDRTAAGRTLNYATLKFRVETLEAK